MLERIGSVYVNDRKGHLGAAMLFLGRFKNPGMEVHLRH